MADEKTYVERKEVTIKFGKGLMGEPFLSKAGKQLVEIKIPNREKATSGLSSLAAKKEEAAARPAVPSKIPEEEMPFR